jgi:hypothetical protein
MAVPGSRVWLSVSLLAAQLGVGSADAQARLGDRAADYRWTGAATVGAGPRLTIERQRTADGALVGLGEPTVRRYPATYYFEGGVIGGSVVGATAAFLFYELACNYSDARSDCAAGPIAEAGSDRTLQGRKGQRRIPTGQLSALNSSTDRRACLRMCASVERLIGRWAGTISLNVSPGVCFCRRM